MSAFEDFVQVELPKRPYLETDAPVESVMIRRGLGPRQLSAINFTANGQVLVMSGGQLTAMPIASIVSGFGGGVRSFILTVVTASSTWNVPHNLASENVIIQAFDENKSVIIPDTMRIVDANSVVLTFNSAQSGVARVIFLD